MSVGTVDTSDAQEPSAARARRRPSATGLTAAGVAFAFVIGAGALFNGYYDLTVWGPLGVATLVAYMVTLVTRRVGPPLLALIPAAGLALLAGVQILSVVWAESTDRALGEGYRTLVYAALAALLAAVAHRHGGRVGLTAGAAAAGGLLTVVVIIELLSPGYAESFFGGRLEEPVGYVNGMAAALVVAAWPFVGLAEGLRSNFLAGGSAGVAALAVLLSTFVQSRGSLIALVGSAVLMILLLPGSVKRGILLLLIAAAAIIGWGAVGEISSSRPTSGGAPTRDAVRAAVLLSLALAGAVGIIWLGLRFLFRTGPVERLSRLRVPRLPAIAAGVLCALAVAVLAGPALVDRADAAWEDFTSLKAPDANSRLASGGGTRYDLWRVGVDQFADHPLKGIGAGNYYRTYFAERRVTEDVRQAHSLELQVAGETGLLGLIGLAVFLGGAGFAVLRARPLARRAGTERALLVSGVGTALYWLLHTSVDWLHRLPSITGLALVGIAVACGLAERANARRRKRSRLKPLLLVAAAVGAAGLGVFTLADRYRAEARSLVARDPTGAVESAQRSLELNGAAVDTLVVLAAAQARRDRYQAARATLMEATRREPSYFLPWALLGDLASRRGNAREAGAYYRRALKLNPRNAALRESVRR